VTPIRIRLVRAAIAARLREESREDIRPR
jgi:hypothetical protein